MSDLKPCPFCGAKAEKIRLAKQWSIHCVECGANVVENTMNCNTTCQISKREVLCVDKWNARADGDELPDTEKEKYRI